MHGTTSEKTSIVARTIRVLVVDDEPEILEELLENSKYHGLAVEAAECGAEALQKIGEIDDISVVCNDINMPSRMTPVSRSITGVLSLGSTAQGLRYRASRDVTGVREGSGPGQG